MVQARPAQDLVISRKSDHWTPNLKREKPHGSVGSYRLPLCVITFSLCSWIVPICCSSISLWALASVTWATVERTPRMSVTSHRIYCRSSRIGRLDIADMPIDHSTFSANHTAGRWLQRLPKHCTRWTWWWRNQLHRNNIHCIVFAGNCSPRSAHELQRHCIGGQLDIADGLRQFLGTLLICICQCSCIP